jgi:hypothetical protein
MSEPARDEFQFWRDAIAGKTVVITADAPQSGYYKMRNGRDGIWHPVAIWTVNGAQVCRVGKDTRAPLDVWTYCAGNPVTKEAAKHAFEHGSWPGDAPEIGHNSGDVSLAEQIAEYASIALAWLKKTGVKDKTTADIAANYRAKLNQLKKEADDARTAENAPHMAAAKAVDDKWREPIAEAGVTAESLRSALTQFMVAEEKRLREEQEAARKAEEEFLAKERARIEAERAEKLRVDPIAALTDSKPEMPVASLEPLPPPKVQAGGQRGRKTGLKTVTKYIVTDYAAALSHVKDHPEVRAAVEKVACAQAKSGAAVPGVETKEEKVAA